MQQLWGETLTFAKGLRRQLHTQPELSWQEHNTARVIRSELDTLGIPWRACTETGTLAELNVSASGDAIALRGDMDALPMHEHGDKPWRSTVDNCMHACGHDGHTATLLATARWLKMHESALPQPVRLVFQPAEEGFHGAKAMIEAGALEGVRAIYGWHNWPALPYGTLACPDGPVMSGNGTFEILVRGKGGHASQPELCRDPLLAASAIILALQDITSRRIAPQHSAVVAVTQCDAGSAPTVIPETARLRGSIRLSEESLRETVCGHISGIAEHIAASYGVTVTVEHHRRYGATVNHEEHAQRARATWQALYGAESLNHGQALPIMASEDFSYYLQVCAGAFALIGSDDGRGYDVPCHSPHYDFNDRLIAEVCPWFCRLAGLDTALLPPRLTQEAS